MSTAPTIAPAVAPVEDELVTGRLTQSGVSGVVRYVHPVTGALHRIGGPAEVLIGFEAWFVNGCRHRLGGPAYVDDQGVQEWWVDDRRHRIDGPATSSPYSDNEWWVNGTEVEAQCDVDVLNELFEAGETRTLEMLLTLWRRGGPFVAELRDAVLAAHG